MTFAEPIRNYIQQLLILLFIFAAGLVSANGPDLMKIEYVPPKGRVQDNRSEIQAIDELLKMGNESIPFLINRLSSERSYRKPPLDYYPSLIEGDLAYIILNDFFTGPDGKSTSVPELCWDILLDTSHHPNTPAWDILDIYHQTHNRDELRKRWTEMWKRHRKEIVWDTSQDFFRIRGLPLVECK